MTVPSARRCRHLRHGGGRRRARLPARVLPYASRLVRSIAPGDISRWARSTGADWATESYKIARAKIYGEMQYEARTLELFWQSELLPVVNEQLEKAGVRLTMLLNTAMQ